MQTLVLARLLAVFCSERRADNTVWCIGSLRTAPKTLTNIVLLHRDKGTLEAKQKGWDEGYCVYATTETPHPHPSPRGEGHIAEILLQRQTCMHR